MEPKLTFDQRQVLKGLSSGKTQPRVDPIRDELVKLGLVEMKLGGWGLTRKGRTRSIVG
jgi:hypothetical protein